MKMKTKPRSLRKPKERAFAAFGIAFLMGCAVFIPCIIYNQGMFWFYGDFNVQQVPFYKMCHEAVRTGQIFWDWNTDLGANFIGSYSFYLLGSPFFWLTLPFPTDFVPYLMGPLLILKMACASFTAYLFLRRFVKEPDFALIGGILYAFSGFSIYNIFFNHFHEAIILFPLLLLSLEQFMVDKRRGFFAAMVFFCAFNNYFFFFSMVVFLIIYFILRCFSADWRVTPSAVLLLGLESVAGVLLSACLLLPAVLAVMQNSRTTEFLVGWNAIVYWREQLYPNLLEVFLFPPDLPSQPLFFPDAQAQWASLGGWLPVFSLAGVFAFLQKSKGHWLRRMIVILTVMAAIPILNSAFVAFNAAYYARWFFMPVLMFCLATCVAMDEAKDRNWWSGWRWTLGLTLAFALVIGFFPEGLEDGKVTRFGLFAPDANGMWNTARFWVTCGIALGALVILAILIPVIKRSPKSFAHMSLACVICVSAIYSLYFVGTGKAMDNNGSDYYNPVLLKNAKTIELPEDGFSRMDTYNDVDNTGMFLGIPSIQAFHSIVPASVSEFYELAGVERGVASRPETGQYGLRSLLSVRWFFDYEGDDNVFMEAYGPSMPGFVYHSNQDQYLIYENENYIPMGFTYDYAMSAEDAKAYGQEHVHQMLLKAMVLSDGDLEKYADLLPSYLPATDPLFTDEELAEDCAARRRTAAYDFEYDTKGFTARINLERDNLVFFSVPYDSGWTARVDGKSVPIVKANGGMMAVPAQAGSRTITFTYETPGLVLGLWLSGGALVFLVLYLLIVRLYRRDHPANGDGLALPPPFTGDEQLHLEDYVEVQRALDRISMELEEENDTPPQKE